MLREMHRLAGIALLLVGSMLLLLGALLLYWAFMRPMPYAIGALLFACAVLAPGVFAIRRAARIFDLRRPAIAGAVVGAMVFVLGTLVALTVLVTLALSTTAVGRIWCGWLCPQTIFMEMLFRKIEWAIDGSAAQQVRLAKAPWTTAKIWRRALKHAIFFGLSFVIANVFSSGVSLEISSATGAG